MTNRYERIRKARQALESLRERCAQEAERITGRRRVVASMVSSQAVKPCEVAIAIRKIDVQQHYECAAREIERMRTEIEALREALEEIRSRSSMNLAMNPNPYELTALLGDIHQIADAALAQENRNDRRG